MAAPLAVMQPSAVCWPAFSAGSGTPMHAGFDDQDDRLVEIEINREARHVPHAGTGLPQQGHVPKGRLRTWLLVQ